MPKVAENLDFSLGTKGVNHPAPSAAGDLANKQYVDNAVAGVEWKTSVEAMATANVNIANPGTAVFDGVTLVIGQRLLLAGQTTASQNGLWIFNGSAAALTRPTDFATGSVQQNAAVQVAGGTAHAKQGWIISGTGTITVDTDPETWIEFATGLVYSGGTGISVSSAGVISLSTLNGKATGTITGDGTTTAFTVAHTLNTTDVIVQVKDSSGNWVIVGSQATDTTHVTISFSVAPPVATTYRVVIIG